LEAKSLLQALAIVVPIFALIGLGFGAARYGLFTPEARRGVSQFAFTFAIPALLFRTIAGATDTKLDPLPVWAGYFGTIAVIWIVASVLTRFVLRRPQQDAASIAMMSSYGNVVMLGIPLALSLLGPSAATPIAIILSIHTPVMWLTGTIHMQLAESAERGTRGGFGLTLLGDLWREMSSNILLVSILAATLWRLTGLGLAPVADTTLALLAQAGVPCALVALGASLVDFEIKGQVPTLTTALFLKLAAMPAVAAVVAYSMLGLAPVSAGVIVLFAAMPAGVNPYLFANRYGRAVNSASGAIALGTLLSVVTSSLLVARLAP
jgi:malonate transporter and related proteins